MHYQIDDTQIEVYLETQKRRLLAGVLHFIKKEKHYQFTYELTYLRNKQAIAVGPELPLTKKTFISEKNKLFPSFLDRIPTRENPAYKEYCQSQGISEKETNPILLLSTIGRRGPSSLIYEPIFNMTGDTVAALKKFRKDLGLSQWDIAELFDIALATLTKIEAGNSHDRNIIQLLHIYLNYPIVTLDKIKLTGKRVHRHTRTKVYRHFKALL